MSMEKTDAIVVRTVDFSESSYVVTAFTRDFGKVEGLAKGARRLKNPFETSLDLLASIKLSFIRKNSDALDIMTSASLVRRFRPTRRNARGLYAGYCVAELLDRATEDYEPAPNLWILADSALAAFQRRPRVAAMLAAFQAKLLEELGLFPSVRACVECGEPLPLDAVGNNARKIWLDLDAGGVVCAKCRATKRFFALFSSTVGALKAIEAAERSAESLVAVEKGFETQYARALENAVEKKIFATELDAFKEKAARARDDLEDSALRPIELFTTANREELRSLLEAFLERAMRRRPRMFDQLGFLAREKTLRDLEENAEERAAQENASQERATEEIAATNDVSTNDDAKKTKEEAIENS